MSRRIRAARKTISKRLRFEIFKRDEFTCQYCGSSPPGALLQLDHIIAVAEGGTDDTHNLTTACSDCNSGKGARSLQIIPPALKDQAQQVAEREQQLRGYHNILEARRQGLEEETWQIVDILNAGTETFNRRGLASIRRFLENLPFHTVLKAAEIASERFPFYGPTTFRYFCGVCWARIKSKVPPT